MGRVKCVDKALDLTIWPRPVGGTCNGGAVLKG